jgi:hypothetical protein
MYLALDKYLWFNKTKEVMMAGTILDLGGGEGLFETLFPENSHQATILEVSANHKARKTPYVVYGGKEIPFRSKSFDIGIALQTLEHVPEQSRKHLITEFDRVVRKQIILAFPIRRLHFEHIFRALFTLYSIAGMPRMKTFYDEHIRYGLPEPELITGYIGRASASAEYYFGRLSCLALLIQLIFPPLIPLSAFFAEVVEKVGDREPVFALLCWK